MSEDVAADGARRVRARTVETYKGDGYFDSYAGLGIHEEMLRCRRTDAYLAAIRSADLEGKVVLDVGCGTGVLAIVCAQCGARAVYAVEASPIVDAARRVVAANGLSDRVHVLEGRVEDVQLPEQVDVIVSEWMGCLLLYESMLESVLFARDRWLAPGGELLPRRARIFLAPYRDGDVWDERVGFWADAEQTHGVDMACLVDSARGELSRKPAVDFAVAHQVAAREACVVDLDLARCSIAEANAPPRADFEFAPDVRAELHGFVGWFDVELVPGAWLSTAPADEPTHWRQTIFYLDAPLPVELDCRLRGSAELRQNAANPRCWDVTIAYACDRPRAAGHAAAADETATRTMAWTLDVSC